VGRKKETLTRGATVLATEREGKRARLRAKRLAGLAAARPKAESGEEREVGRARERAGGARFRPRARLGQEERHSAAGPKLK
jgi:hypothetical protein